MILLILLSCLTIHAIPVDNKNDTTIEPPTNSTKEILKASETGDPTKVEIVKQIRRLNDDGSYTIGYEANDGTFKIESRDVLGNVKGTFGYVAEDGEIKRVTYTSNGESTPIPVTTTTTPSTPAMIMRMNKTVSSTTRRPLATVVYPTRSSATTRGTVIQPIPRRRPVSSTRAPNMNDPTTDKNKLEEATTNMLHLYKNKGDIVRTRTQISNPISVSTSDDLLPKSTTTPAPQTFKPVYEEVTEKEPEIKSNAIRRQLSGTSHNHHMLSLQQSMGDDSTDVYGGHLSHGTVRPLFTTTPRSRLIPAHSVISTRQLIPSQYQEVQLDDQETNIEASTGRVFEQQGVVTANPVPVVHIGPREHHERIYNQPVYRRPATVHFRTDQYLRDNPGSPIPIGNTRPFLQYEYEDKLQQQVLDPRVIKDTPHPKASVHDSTAVPYDVRRVRLIPVDARGVPIPGYQARFVNYRPQPVVQRYDPYDDMNSITAPVSTRDFRRLLHILMMRQNRLQVIMDQLMVNPYSAPYPEYERRYKDDRYDYDQYRQDYNYDNQYESQRYVPRSRYRPYDSVGSSSNNIEEPEYLPVEVREALLLKMLILAISPDYMPTPAPSTELTTAAPTRKQVRNVQILGEEGSSNSKTN